MKLLLLLALSVLSWADEAEELAKEMEAWQESTLKQLQVIQEKANVSSGRMGAIQEKALQLASNEKILQAANAIWAHPNRNMVLWANLGFFIFMILVKAWRQAKCRNWFTKLLVGFGFTIFTWIGMGFLVPWIVLGSSYKVLVQQVFQVLW
jgi:hypothetical protein